MQKSLFLVIATALFIHIGIPKAQAAPSISVDFFYDQLGDYGDWVEVGDYGYGWQPRDVEEDWRPYSDGRWAYTEAGWTWLSDEPYGWAVYHYGRWAQIERKGWVWIPGTEWAPAWVSWRRSAQYVGWAPLPPEATFRHSVGFSGWVDSYYDIGPSAYRFVEVRDFGAPRLRSVFVEQRENAAIIRQTRNITQITYSGGFVNNRGPRYEDISRESAEPVRRLKLDRRVAVEGDRSSFRGEQLRPRVEGDSLRLFAPGFDARSAAPPAKLSARIENVQVNRGWKDAGPAADVEKLRAQVRGEARAPKGLPAQPKFQKLAEQPAAPPAEPTTERPVPAKPGEKPRGEKPKDGRVGRESPAAPVTPAAEPKVAPLNPIAPDAPLRPQKPGKSRSVEQAPVAEVPAKPPTETEVKPEKTRPPAAKPTETDRHGKKRPQTELPPPIPVDPVEPKTKQQRPEARKELPPPPEQTAPKNERSFPPPSAPRREAPEPPKPEPRQPKPERPEAARSVPPPVEKPKAPTEHRNPPNTVPGNAPQPQPAGEAQKAKPGKEKAKDDPKTKDEAPKAQ